VGIFDRKGTTLAAIGGFPHPPALEAGALIRRSAFVEGRSMTAIFAPLEVQGRHVATLGVGLPSRVYLSTARSAALRLALVLFVAMSGVIGIGALLSRSIVGRLRPLLDTSRSLGRGELAARIPVNSGDELGELAAALNQMADQLEASHTSLERRVAERTEEIQRLLRERSELFAGISHELRTPIAVILSETKLALRPVDPKGGWTRETGETIIRSAEQLLDVVEDILKLARAESNRLVVEPAEVAVPDLIEDVRSIAKRLAAANGLRFSVEIAPKLPLVWADPVRMKDVLLNLVDNAVKYTPAGGTVTLAAKRRNGSVDLIVSDTGIGIPRDVGERVFEPFFRAPGARTQHGEAASGLGLALARRLVEAQGGTIAFASDNLNGTTFTVGLDAVTTRRSKG
jgi:signal transduction histidine kinase